MSDLHPSKTELRQEALALRNRLPVSKMSNTVCERLEEWSVFQDAEKVLCYYPFRNEINLLDLCFLHPEKSWYLPRVDAQSMQFLKYNSGDVLHLHRLGMMEPAPDCERLIDFSGALVLIPALMADLQGYRLGYGQGNYDRFLARLPANVITAAVVPEALLTERLPAESWDRPVQYLVSETRIATANLG